MGKAFTDFALQTGQSALGQAMGLATGAIQNKRQLKQQGKLQAQEIQGQKQMIDYEQMKQLQMWKDTNYGPQMEQLKAAGLNPGLIYGMSGGGGATTGQTSGNVTGGHAQGSTGTEAITMGTTMAQMGLLRAQKELIEAQKNKEVATTPAAGQTAAKIGAETASLTQGIENQKAQQELTEVQTRIEYVREHVATMTQNHAVAMIQTELSKNLETLGMLKNERTISDNTIRQKEGIIRMTYALMVLEQYKKTAETANIDQQTRESVNRVEIAIQQNMRDWDKMSQVNEQLDINKGLWDDLPNPLKEILDNILVIPRLGKGGTPPPIKGFHKR